MSVWLQCLVVHDTNSSIFSVFSLWTINSSDCRISLQEKPTKWGLFLITFNLRKRQFSIQVQIPQIVGFGFAQKHAK